ncbi:MAG: DUF3667 domain-containing protein [Flavobacterium sp.]|uniref:DUF3667 domain-containing protein n=1 Tax=Flavobacterium sp. TaxID=239 RepID=UPI0025C63CC8|nr:DUF3667 domain-containing protein [Flavobacterium sp.]MCK6608261.1 DUF3667 domain-containing protein [Flavobacterium sp.]
MQITCKNCNQTYSGHFCNNCGQPADTHKLNLHFIWHDIQHAFFHFDKGVLFTAKELFTRPGDSIREFIEGKRVKHFKPISLVIILATLYGVLRHFFHFSILDKKAVAEIQGVEYESLNEWISHHYYWIILLSIPLFSIASYLVFRRQGYNFIEHFVLNTYMASQRLLLRIAIFPITKYYTESNYNKLFVDILMLLDIVLIFWSYITFFNNLSRIKAFLYSIFSYLLFLVIFVILLLLGVFIFDIHVK